jgi:hypothetical protein
MQKKYKILLCLSFYVISFISYSMNLDSNRKLPFFESNYPRQFFILLTSSYKHGYDKIAINNKASFIFQQYNTHAVNNCTAQQITHGSQMHIDFIETCILILSNKSFNLIHNFNQSKEVLLLYIIDTFQDEKIRTYLVKKWLLENSKFIDNNISNTNPMPTTKDDFALKKRVTDLEFQNKSLLEIGIIIFLTQCLFVLFVLFYIFKN